MRRDFIFILTKDLLKAKESCFEANEVLGMVEDIVNNLENGVEEDYETSQQHIGVRQSFRGFAVKD